MSNGTLTEQYQRPEGALIARAMAVMGLSGRKAAALAGISDARWRQIVNGYTTVGIGQVVPVSGPDATLARMARVVGVTAAQLRDAGRADAAEALSTLTGMQAESEWQAVGTALDRLLMVREALDDVISELRAAPATPGGPTCPPPQVQVGESDV